MITANDAATLTIASPNATDLLVILNKKVVAAATNGLHQVVFTMPPLLDVSTVCAQVASSLDGLGYDVENYDTYLIVKW